MSDGRSDAPGETRTAPPHDEAAAPDPAGATCPLPLEDYPAVVLGHGSGGKLSKQLLDELFLPALGGPALRELHDGAVLPVGDGRLAVSTDTFVVDPLFFPGGDIGSLAVHGTVNDVAMCGATPVALSVGFILEEGFPMERLWHVARSVSRAASAAGVPVVTGDTKVVDRGKGDGVYLNTTGIGIVREDAEISPRRARPGDRILVSGPVASHGVAILSVREGLEFETRVESDTAALHDMAADLLDALGRDVHVLRDPTRGGVASATNEIAAAAGAGIVLEEARIPMREEVRGACEILGLDPLFVANEGILLAVVEGRRAEEALQVVRAHERGGDGEVIGRVVEDHPGRVFQRSRIGGTRVVEMLSGEQLPRIC